MIGANEQRDLKGKEELQLPCQVTAGGDLGRCGGRGDEKLDSKVIKNPDVSIATRPNSAERAHGREPAGSCVNKTLRPRPHLGKTGSSPSSAPFALGSLEQSFPLSSLSFLIREL